MPANLPYRYLLTAEVFEFYQTLRLAERRTLKNIFWSLADRPFSQGDHQELDESGRIVEVLLKGSFVLTFWADHPAREVRIVQVGRT